MSETTENPIREAIAEAIRDHEVILFMKGTPERPACGFSARTVAALEALDVVDHGAPHVRKARAVDEDPQPVVLEHLVALALGVEGKRVLEAGAAAPAHADPQAGSLDLGTLTGQELLHLLGALFGEGDHRFRKDSAR